MSETNGTRRRAPLRAEPLSADDAPARDTSDTTVVMDQPSAPPVFAQPTDPAAKPSKADLVTDETILECKGIDVSYGPVQILFGVDLEVKRGEVVALLGTNGAGKSTLLKAICGLKAPKAGTVTFAGEDITGMSADLVTHKGAALMPGGKGIFPTLTVAENLRAGAYGSPGLGLGPDGHLVVVWEDSVQLNVMARCFDPQGQATGPAFVLNTSRDATCRLNPRVKVNASGAFVAVWEHGWTQTRARIFASAGQSAGDELPLGAAALRRGA